VSIALTHYPASMGFLGSYERGPERPGTYIQGAMGAAWVPDDGLSYYAIERAKGEWRAVRLPWPRRLHGAAAVRAVRMGGFPWLTTEDCRIPVQLTRTR
jgi:hypothetical protein